jgi:hypothetical protein
MRASFRYAFSVLMLAAPLLQSAGGCDSDLSPKRSRVACVSTTNR